MSDRRTIRPYLGFFSWLLDKPFAEHGNLTLACGRVYRFSPANGDLLGVRDINAMDTQYFPMLRKRKPRLIDTKSASK